MQPTRRPDTPRERSSLTASGVSDASRLPMRCRPCLGFPFQVQHCLGGERRVSEAEAPARRQRAPVAPAELTRLSMRAAAQRPTRAHSNAPSVVDSDLPRVGAPEWPRRPRPPSNLPRERYRPSEKPGTPSTARKPRRELSLPGRHPSAARRRLLGWSRLFHDPNLAALTGMAGLESRRVTPKGPAGTTPSRATCGAPDSFCGLVVHG